MKIARTLLNFCLIPLLMVGLFLPAPTFQAAGADADGPFSLAARQALADLPSGESASFIITLREQLASEAGAASPLQAAAALPGKAARRTAVIEALQAYANQQHSEENPRFGRKPTHKIPPLLNPIYLQLPFTHF